MKGVRKATRVVVEAPASSANLGPGFDVYALALKKPVDRLSLSTEHSPSLQATIKISEASKVPESAGHNTASYVALEIARDRGIKARLTLELEKGVREGVGLGSSAASAVAAAVAMDRAFGLQLDPAQLIAYAARGEEISSGTAHYDNVSASLLGGFIVVLHSVAPRAVSFPAPRSLRLCLATPSTDLPERKTEYARSVLPSVSELAKTVHNVSMASAVLSGFAKGDVGLIGEGMTNDEIVEPARSGMIPGYERVRRAALKSGASGVCISGAGPTMLAAVDSRKKSAKNVLQVMISAFEKEGVASDGFVTAAGEGAKVLEG
jgi:homoserine kinase